jgi:hypothetical protein
MYIIYQEIANKIAKTVELKYNLTKKMFKATEEQAEEIEIQLRKQITNETNSIKVAMAVSIYLPLLLENEAITQYLNKTKENLRGLLPEILSPREAALIAQMDQMMTEKETIQAQDMFQRILDRQDHLYNQQKIITLKPPKKITKKRKQELREILNWEIEQLMMKYDLTRSEALTILVNKAEKNK